MKISDILKKVGTGIIRSVVPGAGAVIDIVNEFLPEDKKLPADATGPQVQDAVDSLPPSDRAAIMSKKLDIEITEIQEWSKVVDSLAAADATGQTTRPDIAMMMAWVVVFVDVVCVVALGYAVYQEHIDISEAWPMALALLGIPAQLLRSYFGLRTEEKKARYASAVGQQHAPGIMATLGSLLGGGKK